MLKYNNQISLKIFINKITLAKLNQFNNSSVAELTRLYSTCLQESVYKHLISDVPVGSYLSGGMDSGSITAHASKQVNRLSTFTCGFDMSRVTGVESNYDERYISGHIETEYTTKNKYNEQYLSLTFKHVKFGTFTFISNQEELVSYLDQTISSKDFNRWNGFQWTYDFHQKFSNNNLSKYLLGDSRLSIFYGSQKGGLVCANGICATQPEFLNGFKLNYTRLF